MKSATNFEWDHPFGTGFFKKLTCFLNTGYAAGDHQLSRAVIISRHNNLFNILENVLYIFIFHPNHSGHGRWLHFTSLLHSHGPL